MSQLGAEELGDRATVSLPYSGNSRQEHWIGGSHWNWPRFHRESVAGVSTREPRLGLGEEFGSLSRPRWSQLPPGFGPLHGFHLTLSLNAPKLEPYLRAGSAPS